MVRDLLGTLRIAGPPVNLDYIASKLGVERVEDAPMGSLLGQVSSEEGSIVIRLNDDMPERRRFTLAHEVAHTMLEPNLSREQRAFMRKPHSYGAVERLCDEIAQELLMPYDMIDPLIFKSSVGIRTVEALARTFDTSIEAAAIRYGRLSAHPARVVAWRPGNQVIEVKWARGRGREGALVTRGKAYQLTQWPSVSHALACGHIAVANHLVEGIAAYSESKVYGNGWASYVLTLIKPQVRASELRGRQLVNHRNCERVA